MLQSHFGFQLNETIIRINFNPFNFLFCLIKKETKKSSPRFLIGQISFRILKEKNSLTLKQLFFLRILQTFDARLRKLRTT